MGRWLPVERPDPEGRHRTQRQATQPRSLSRPHLPTAWGEAPLAGGQASGGELGPQGPGQALPPAAGAAASARSTGSRGSCGATLTAILPTASGWAMQGPSGSSDNAPSPRPNCVRGPQGPPQSPMKGHFLGGRGRRLAARGWRCWGLGGLPGGSALGGQDPEAQAGGWLPAPHCPAACPQAGGLSWPLPSRVSSGQWGQQGGGPGPGGGPLAGVGSGSCCLVLWVILY